MKTGTKLKRTVCTLICLVTIFAGVVQDTFAENKKNKKVSDIEKFSKLWKSVRKLTKAEALALDKQVDNEPDNLDAVTRWLIYNNIRAFRDAKIKKKREKIIFHLITNYPEHTIFTRGYTGLYRSMNDVDTVIKLWKTQLKKHPENVKVLSNAARSLFHIDKTLCEKCLKKCQKLEPDNPRWSKRLGFLFYLNSKNGKDKYALQSYKEYKRAYKQIAVDKRSAILTELGRAAYILGKHKEAEKCAREMLERGEKSSSKWDKGKYLYHAYTLFGLLALKDGKVEEAGKYLIESGKVIESSKGAYFFMDMSLACMLLFKEQDKPVMKFLETVAKYSVGNKCKQYIEDIKEGVMPVFKSVSYSRSLRNKVFAARRKKYLSIGKKLSAEKVLVLEKELAATPGKDSYKIYGTITKLLGYYYAKMKNDKSIREKRRQLVYRIVEYFPRYSLLANPVSWLQSETPDKKLIELCKVNIKKFPESTCVLLKASCQLTMHDNKLAEQCLKKCQEVEPDNPGWKKRLAAFHARVNKKSSSSKSDK